MICIDIIKHLDSIFGKVVAYVYTIEFQKRGLPHMHLLVSLQTTFYTPEEIDQFITAQIPDKNLFPELYKLVIKHMLHGPHTNTSSCLKKNNIGNIVHNAQCKKGFPHPFNDATDITKPGFAQFQRKDNTNENHFYYNSNIKTHNGWVVPYNPYLLMRYRTHINVLHCTTFMVIKYIFKYICKGHDRGRFSLNTTTDCIDEIQDYIDARTVGAMEATWRLLELSLNGRSHSVTLLQIHLPQQNIIHFIEGEEENTISNENKTATTLTQWFHLNTTDSSARQYLYEEIPLHYRYDLTSKHWIKRQRNTKTISRLVTVSPKDFERYALKLLLRRIPGALSFEYLKTFQGILYTTFGEAAKARQIINEEGEQRQILEEAAAFMMPIQFRKFFISLLFMTETTSATLLYDEFKPFLLDDNISEEECLNYFANFLIQENSSSTAIGLPLPQNFYTLIEQDSIPQNTYYTKWNQSYLQLNYDQKFIFDDIKSNIANNQQILCFIDGPAGTGKTFLYNVVYDYIKSNNKSIQCLAWTGLAANLLPNGKTLHRFFKLPINMHDNKSLLWNTHVKTIINAIDFIIIDEVSMVPAHAINAIDQALQDMYNNNLYFGGKHVLFGGDFRQLLPVVKKGSKQNILETCFKSCTCWDILTKYTLTINMRAQNDSNFQTELLQIGNGILSSLPINSQLLTKELINDTFITYNNLIDVESLSNKIILSPKNMDVSTINHAVLQKCPGETIISEAITNATTIGEPDSMDNRARAMIQFPPEYIETIDPPAVPPQKLLLKHGCTVMLIRNINLSEGLCNGTRLKFLNMTSESNYIMKCQKLDFEKTIVYIPRIKLSTAELSDLPFTLWRTQFPVKLCFAISINKSQGQSFDNVGLYFPLNSRIFSHGQLYVAMSRCKSKAGLKLFIENENQTIDNIVYREILS